MFYLLQESKLRDKFAINMDSDVQADWLSPATHDLLRQNVAARDTMDDEYTRILGDLKVLRSEVS